MDDRSDSLTPVLLTARETAGVLRISERLTWRLIAEGELATVRIGRRRLVPRRAIDAYIAARMAAGDTDAA